MTEILQIFQGNPLSTFIGKKIEASTRPELESEDWALNMEICDMINENDDDAKDAVRAIRKRLQQLEQDRNFTITNRTLTVLETCVSNCSRRFHVLVMTKDFIQDLVKLIGPKNNPPIDLQERVLRMIERWAEAFKNQPDLSGVVTVYNDLKSKGVTFPPRDPNSNVPIQTPQRTVGPRQASPLPTRTSATRHEQAHQPQLSSGPVVLEGDGYNKISQDLGVVQTSVEMFNEIMQQLEGKSDEPTWKLAADLNATCRQMKDRIVDLIERVANEDLTIELLRLNDDLNNIFIKYDRLVKNRGKLGGVSAQTIDTTASSASAIQSSLPNELSLIDFNADESTGDHSGSSTVDPFASPGAATASAAVQKKLPHQKPSEQADTIGQDLGRLSLEDGKPETRFNANKTIGLPEEISSVREQDFAEIENWLKTDSGRELTSLSGDSQGGEPISIPNSEFENFLASRALAGSVGQQTTSASTRKQDQKPEPSL